MKTLGIIGGMSPESTAIYYSQINRLVNEQLGGNHSAKIILHSLEFEEIVQKQQSGDWQGAGAVLAQSAQNLQNAGADAIILATNTMHKVADLIKQKIDIPFLHILDAVADAILQRNMQTIGLLGTKFTMSDDFYRHGLATRGVQTIVPNEATQNQIHKIIFEELCVGKFTPSSQQFYLQTIADLAQKGAQGVILGCTEIGLLINQHDTTTPLFDTTALHIAQAVAFCLNETA